MNFSEFDTICYHFTGCDLCFLYTEYSEMHYLTLNPQKHSPFRRFRKQLNLRYGAYNQDSGMLATFDLMMGIEFFVIHGIVALLYLVFLSACILG